MTHIFLLLDFKMTSYYKISDLIFIYLYILFYYIICQKLILNNS